MDTVLAKQNMNETNKIWQKVIEALTDPAADMDDEEEAAYMNRIMAKLKSGKKLTAEELDYLKLHNPQLYMTAMRVQHKKEILQQRLKNCKSKQEAQDVIDSAIGSITKEDPDKEYLIAGIREVEKEFKKTAFYKRLPEKEEKTERKKLVNYLFSKNPDGEYAGEDGQDKMFLEGNVTPIAELLDVLPVFEAKA